MGAIQTTGAPFQINNAKLYVSVVTLSINDDIKILENIKQGFKRIIYWNTYKSEITKKTKKNNNNLDYLIDSMITMILREILLISIICH